MQHHQALLGGLEQYLISVRATAGTSYAQQVEKFGQNYILPVVGDRRIGDLNTGMLQDVLNRAYKEGSMKPQATRKSRETSRGKHCRESERLKSAL